ncbi:UPF0223 family protein [Streptococcus sp. DD12]|uniref:UPF0223 family protein n=1 Tax=Streptococcus sp. DD12 TaxID=1777880 RepID=UPI00079A6A99|nr:UPF0223 family protein [Streptococcus sp. DD12]KXT76820.1 hypothetical protein STRDD12_00225 [Streptococcus sp. DD12]
MTKSYSYPLDYSWTADEMTTVIQFFNAVEKAYESQVAVADLLACYRAFKIIVPGKAQEKQLDREFEKISGYSTYRAVTAAKEKQKGGLSLGR